MSKADTKLTDFLRHVSDSVIQSTTGQIHYTEMGLITKNNNKKNNFNIETSLKYFSEMKSVGISFTAGGSSVCKNIPTKRAMSGPMQYEQLTHCQNPKQSMRRNCNWSQFHPTIHPIGCRILLLNLIHR
jgi:hypothetical protein